MPHQISLLIRLEDSRNFLERVDEALRLLGGDRDGRLYPQYCRPSLAGIAFQERRERSENTDAVVLEEVGGHEQRKEPLPRGVTQQRSAFFQVLEL